VHAVVPDVECVPCTDEAEEETIEAYDADGNFIGAFNRFNKKAGGGGSGTGRPNRFQKKPPANGTAQETRRPPRRCPNCSNEHPGECKEPKRAYGERTCWTCGKAGCSAQNCPKKPGPLKAIEDQQQAAGNIGLVDRVVFAVADSEGYIPARQRRRAIAPCRPMPRGCTLGDIIASGNRYNALQHDCPA
jgi:hypothetical protein